MPPDDDTVEEQTHAFHPPAGWPDHVVPAEPVHLLLLLDDNAPPKRFPLRSLPAVIGRTVPADLVLEGNTVSRRHCRLEADGATLRLLDLGSTNGTFVNGIRLMDAIVLDDGATIGIGAYRLRYHRRNMDESADADAMEQELREATKYVESVLPRPIEEGPVRASWFYRPSTGVGGDAFGYQILGKSHFAFFLLDVAGHGAGAAMHAMAVSQTLRERSIPGVDFRYPADVIAGLNAMFPMDRNNDLFFTIWYGVHDIANRVLVFAAAGHHAAYLLQANPATAPPVALETVNPMIGMMPSPKIVSARVDVPHGATLHLFSDGVFEVVDRLGRQLGLDDILPLLPDAARFGPRRLYEQIRALARPGPLDDDFSALVLRFP